MKLTIFLFVISIFAATANSYSQQSRFNLHYENVTIKEVLNEIKSQSDLQFFYSNDDFDINRKVNVQVSDASVEDVLNQILNAMEVSYKISDNVVIISRSDVKWSFGKNQQSFGVKGKVTDGNGVPLPGVTVVVKGTVRGTITDVNGHYSLPDIKANDMLVFSFVGMRSREIEVLGKTSIDIVLEEETVGIEEVVAIGYGTMKKSDLTGAVASVNQDNIRNMPNVTIDQKLAGQVAGVQVSQPTGIPGGGISVRVRGTGSVGAGNEPLYVIDGFPYESSYNQTSNPLASLNPNDIESMEILKDASATAIYGSRGSNGVVIITTKSGEKGKANINFDAYYGFQQVSKTIDLLNAQEYAAYITDSRNNGWIASGPNRSASDPNSVRGNAIYQIPPGLENPAALGEGTDWQDEIFREGVIQNYQISFSGGDQNTSYFVSGGYHKTEGIIINSDFERYSFRVNLESSLSKRIKAGVNISPSYSFSNIIDSEGHFGNGAVVLSALLMPPHLPVKNEDGSYTTGVIGYGLSGVQNPVQTARQETNQRGLFKVLGTTFAEINIVDDLRFRATVGADFEAARRNSYNPSTTQISGQAVGTSGTGQNINWLTEYTLTYSREIGKHSFEGLVGYTAQKNIAESNYLSATSFPNDLVHTLNAGVVSEGSSGEQQWSLISYIARLNYQLSGKYLLTATVRRDGSSRFGANNKWGVFPSASVGWRISEENFLKNAAWLNNLKLRASYGRAGNNGIGNYEHIALASIQNYILGPNGGSIVNGLYTNRLSNPDLGWETNTQADVGLDISLFRNRIALTADYYDKITSNLLLQVPVPALTGYENVRDNIGKVKNNGVELGLSTHNFTGKFQWKTDFNISFNKNKVLALGPGDAPIYAGYDISSIFVTKVGLPLGNFFGYQVKGIYLDQDDVDSSPHFADSKPGQLKFKDVSGEGTLSTEDRTVLGSPFPDFTYGLTNNFSFRGLELNILIQGVEGAERLNLGRRFYANYAGTANSLTEVKNRWRSPENPGDGQTPMVNRDLGKYTSSNSSANVSSKFVEDASYLRISSISLGYNFPKSLANRLSIQNLRVYANIQNVFTFTKYTGFNPDVSLVGHSTLTPGIDYGTYPLPRTYTMGLNFSF